MQATLVISIMLKRVRDLYSHLQSPMSQFLTMLKLGINPPRAPSPSALHRASSTPAPHNKSVQFASDTSSEESPNRHRRRRRRSAKAESYGTSDSDRSSDDGRHRRNKRSGGRSHVQREPSPAQSDETIDLPERFDEHGRLKPERGEDPIADKIEDFLAGKGSAGKLFKNLTDGLLGGGSKEKDRDDGRRRR